MSEIETVADCCLMSRFSDKIVLDYAERRKLCLEVVDDSEKQARSRQGGGLYTPKMDDDSNSGQGIRNSWKNISSK